MARSLTRTQRHPPASHSTVGVPPTTTEPDTHPTRTPGPSRDNTPYTPDDQGVCVTIRPGRGHKPLDHHRTSPPGHHQGVDHEVSGDKTDTTRRQPHDRQGRPARAGDPGRAAPGERPRASGPGRAARVRRARAGPGTGALEHHPAPRDLAVRALCASYSRGLWGAEVQDRRARVRSWRERATVPGRLGDLGVVAPRERREPGITGATTPRSTRERGREGEGERVDSARRREGGGSDELSGGRGGSVGSRRPRTRPGRPGPG